MKKRSQTRRAGAARFRLQGIAAALGELADAHMEADLAEQVLAGMGLTIADLEAAGADPYDLGRLKK